MYVYFGKVIRPCASNFNTDEPFVPINEVIPVAVAKYGTDTELQGIVEEILSGHF